MLWSCTGAAENDLIVAAAATGEDSVKRKKRKIGIEWI